MVEMCVIVWKLQMQHTSSSSNSDQLQGYSRPTKPDLQIKSNTSASVDNFNSFWWSVSVRIYILLAPFEPVCSWRLSDGTQLSVTRRETWTWKVVQNFALQESINSSRKTDNDNCLETRFNSPQFSWWELFTASLNTGGLRNSVQHQMQLAYSRGN